VNLVGNEAGQGLTLIAASTGNHGQSIAYAGRLFGARVIIYAPAENVNESKMQAMRDLGAEVRLHGRDFDEARLEIERLAVAEGYRYVHSANEPGLIAGVGTIGLEIFEDLPDVDVIIAPAGGGQLRGRQLHRGPRTESESASFRDAIRRRAGFVARVPKPLARSLSDHGHGARRPGHARSF
jgi:hypothetical protein